MLELENVSLTLEQAGDPLTLLSQITAKFPRNHFAAIIGPSGCGKSTLLKTIAGIARGEEEGHIFWDRRDLEEEDFEPSEIGYVPQFSIAHAELTVQESVEMALRLRVGGLRSSRLEETTLSFLQEVGLDAFADRRVAVLSGGQQRRLSLAMEIASRPHILLCDEVTSGLDPQSEEEIVQLLHTLSRGHGRLILSVTHSLQHLDLYDSIFVLIGGHLAFHGPPAYLAHYFQVEKPEMLFPQLARRSPEAWSNSWIKHQRPFLKALQKESSPLPGTSSTTDPSSTQPGAQSDANAPNERASDEKHPLSSDEDTLAEEPSLTAEPIESKAPPAIPPGPFHQFLVLLQRRCLIFSRSGAQLWMQAGLIFGFPLLVALFAWNGLPAVSNLSMGLDLDVVSQLVEAKEFLLQATKIGSLVSGIVMFQVILLTLMGANNSGREIAAERLIFEKEKLSGLSPLSYVASKVVFLSLLVAMQSLWMGIFVHFVCGFPGALSTQLLFLLLVNGAMTAICLALSAWLGSAEQASLASIYLVGFQLPLSGAVLALPEPFGLLARPFIAAYWSWSGVLQTLREERYYDIIQIVVQTTLSPAGLCLLVLGVHIVAGVLLAWLGCQRSRWQ